MRESADAFTVNPERTVKGVPLRLGIFVLAIFFIVSIGMLDPWLLVPLPVALWYIHGATKRDVLFFEVYRKHTKMGLRYVPYPRSAIQQRNRRPIGYGRMDAN